MTATTARASSRVKTVRGGEYGAQLLDDPDKYFADARAEAHDDVQRHARRVAESIFGPLPAPARTSRWRRRVRTP